MSSSDISIGRVLMDVCRESIVMMDFLIRIENKCYGNFYDAIIVWQRKISAGRIHQGLRPDILLFHYSTVFSI